jgi:outer membrane protein assembly factor BamE (lipoprotein component of BamABCDE complex)
MRIMGSDQGARHAIDSNPVKQHVWVEKWRALDAVQSPGITRSPFHCSGMDVSYMNCKFRIVAAALLVTSLGACSAIVDTRGNMLTQEQIALIKPGVDDRDRVRRVLGSPTSTSAFDQSAWYYIARKTETTAFFTPNVVESQVVVIRFTEQGVVSDVERRGAEATAEVDVSDRATPTAGTGEGILGQLFGNIGRFSKAGGGRPVSTTVPRR